MRPEERSVAGQEYFAINAPICLLSGHTIAVESSELANYTLTIGQQHTALVLRLQVYVLRADLVCVASGNEAPDATRDHVPYSDWQVYVVARGTFSAPRILYPDSAEALDFPLDVLVDRGTSSSSSMSVSSESELMPERRGKRGGERWSGR